MLFTSYGFILFISILVIVYYITSKKYQWILLLGASYLFYFFSGAKYIIYILLTTVSTYVISLIIHNLRENQSRYLTNHKQDLSRAERKAYRAKIKSKKWKGLLIFLCFIFRILCDVEDYNIFIV